MKPALSLVLTALLLPACGGGTGTATSKTASPESGKSAAPKTQPAPASQPATAQSSDESADPTDVTPEENKVNQLLKALDDMPTQDELDAAAAARIDESAADAEYEKLKQEIEAELAKPPEDG